MMSQKSRSSWSSQHLTRSEQLTIWDSITEHNPNSHQQIMTSTPIPLPIISVIKLKLSINKLNDKEYDSFLATTWRNIGTQEMVKLLNSQYLRGTAEEHDHENLDIMRGIASDIIRSRHKSEPVGKNQEHKPTIKLTFQTLPSFAINEIASFTDQKTYAHLSRVSRRSFVDSNSPNKLAELDLNDIPPNTTINLNKFLKITTCNFTSNNYNPFDADQNAFANHPNLRILNITTRSGSNTNSLDTIINHTSPCFAKLDEISWTGCGIRNGINFERFTDLLQKTPSLTVLCLKRTGMTGIFDVNKIKECCPKIRWLQLFR